MIKDFEKILSNPDRQESILKYARRTAPELVPQLKQIFKDPGSTKSIEIYGENDNLLKENSEYTILNDDNNSSSITFPYITKVKYIKLTRDHFKHFPGINVTYYNENNMVANLLRTENKEIMYLNFISRK